MYIYMFVCHSLGLTTPNYCRSRSSQNVEGLIILFNILIIDAYHPTVYVELTATVISLSSMTYKIVIITLT